MKLITYEDKSLGIQSIAMVEEDRLYDLRMMDAGLPGDMQGLLNEWLTYLPLLKELHREISTGNSKEGIPLGSVRILSPVPAPPSLRDGYAFRQHVATARRNRGLDMIPAFDEYPVFYFGNHRTVTGPGVVNCMPDHFEHLDFELECAVVICKEGKNIRVSDADSYIGGLMIMNDISARRLQMEEMLLNLGPAKGKDFATAFGPWLVTLDSLADHEVACKEGHTGKAWYLQMEAFVNGRQVCSASLADMDWTFAELIERASYGVKLYPGDIIGSGTCGAGCFLELNGTARRENPESTDQWLQPGDTVDLSVTALGTLSNTFRMEKTKYSLLEQKKLKAKQV